MLNNSILRNSSIKTSKDQLSPIIQALNETLRNLALEQCVPCSIAEPVTDQQLIQYFPDWKLSGETIEKEFRFSTYAKGLDFANAIGRIAIQQDHHPDILIKWRRVKLSLTTHARKMLTRNDLVMAAKAELEYRKTLENPAK